MATQKETVDEHSGTIREHDRLLVTLVERVDGVRDDISRVELLIKELDLRLRSIEAESLAAKRDSARLDKRLDEIASRRFEVGKLILAAALGGLVTLIANVSIRFLERSLDSNSSAAAPQRAR